MKKAAQSPTNIPTAPYILITETMEIIGSSTMYFPVSKKQYILNFFDKQENNDRICNKPQ